MLSITTQELYLCPTVLHNLDHGAIITIITTHVTVPQLPSQAVIYTMQAAIVVIAMIILDYGALQFHQQVVIQLFVLV